MSVATDAIRSVSEALQSISEVKGKIFHVLTEDELIVRATTLQLPAVGIVYEGMRSTGDGGKPSHRIGLAAELSVAIVLLYKGSQGIGREASDVLKPDAIAILDTIRSLFRDKTGPSGKYWHFVAEMPASEKGGLVQWIQRWSLPVTLTNGL